MRVNELIGVFRVAVLAAVAAALLFTLGCGGPAPQSGPSPGLPELTKDVIDQRINDARVHDVLPESGTGEPISWSFDEDEPKEITMVDQQVNGTKATIVLDIKTESSPRSRNRRQLAGQIRTEWELVTRLVLRRWEIIDTENISMKYRDLPKPAQQDEPAR